jgi:hypothetical protein
MRNKKVLINALTSALGCAMKLAGCRGAGELQQHPRLPVSSGAA